VSEWAAVDMPTPKPSKSNTIELLLISLYKDVVTSIRSVSLNEYISICKS